MKHSNLRRTAQSIVLAVGLIFAFPLPVFSEEVQDRATPSVEGYGLSDTEKDEFQEYLENEIEYQKSVDTSPVVVDGNAAAPKMGVFTTNPVETRDNRIGALYFSKLPGVASLSCTANYIGGKFWSTAHHCVDGKTRTVGFIEQSDGEFAGIENIYTKSGNYDVALIKVGSGIGAENFRLSNTRPAVGAKLQIVGFAGVNKFSSKSSLEVLDPNIRVYYPEDDHTYYDLFRSKPVAPNNFITSGGDSGASVWAGDVMFGIHSGSNERDRTYSANIAPHVPWIQQTMSNNSNSTADEIFHAFRGGLAVSYARNVDLPDPIGSSS